MPQPRYKRTSGAVFNLHLHFVWCPKYRRKVLLGEVETRLRELLREKANELGIEVEGLEVMPDHVHLFVAVPPTDAPQFYANQFKGYTSRVLRQEFPLSDPFCHPSGAAATMWARRATSRRE
jgi:putative transposase